MSDDRPSNAHLSVNHTHHILAEVEKRLIVDIKKSHFLGSVFFSSSQLQS